MQLLPVWLMFFFFCTAFACAACMPLTMPCPAVHPNDHGRAARLHKSWENKIVMAFFLLYDGLAGTPTRPASTPGPGGRLTKPPLRSGRPLG